MAGRGDPVAAYRRWVSVDRIGEADGRNRIRARAP